MLTKGISDSLSNKIYDKIDNIISRYIDDGVDIYSLKRYFKSKNNLSSLISDIQNEGERLFNIKEEYLSFIKNVIKEVLDDRISELETGKLSERIVLTFENFMNENNIENDLIFLGYHSTKYELDGYNKGEILDSDDYGDVIRNIYLEMISDSDENIQNGDIDGMNTYFEENEYGFTFVSDDPIEASSFQSSVYKYGDVLYKVYGNGDEYILDDHNEINAKIIMHKNALFFEKVTE